MSQNYLLEIGLEEIPAHVVTPSINQLVERMTSFLKENRLSFDKIEAYSTPRRLAPRLSVLPTSKKTSRNWLKVLQKRLPMTKTATGRKPPKDSHADKA